MTDFNSKEEAIAYCNFKYAEKSIDYPMASIVFMAFSLEAFLKEICLKNNITLDRSQEFQSAITQLCNPINLIPKDIYYSNHFKTNYFYELKNKRNNIAHASGSDLIIIAKKLLSDFNRFIKWYSQNYNNDNWETIFENNKHKYLEVVNYELNEDAKGTIRAIIREEINSISNIENGALKTLQNELKNTQNELNNKESEIADLKNKLEEVEKNKEKSLNPFIKELRDREIETINKELSSKSSEIETIRAGFSELKQEVNQITKGGEGGEVDKDGKDKRRNVLAIIALTLFALLLLGYLFYLKVQTNVPNYSNGNSNKPGKPGNQQDSVIIKLNSALNELIAHSNQPEGEKMVEVIYSNYFDPNAIIRNTDETGHIHYNPKPAKDFLYDIYGLGNIDAITLFNAEIEKNGRIKSVDIYEKSTVEALDSNDEPSK